jgi:hypothetical protein
VKYKVLIKKCTDLDRANIIAQEIARWSGSTVDVVRNAIIQKAVCIRREADEDETRRLKAQFEGIGAEIELVALTAGVHGNTGDDEDDDEAPGRVLTDVEYASACANRPDIFVMDNSTRLRNTEIVILVVGIICGWWMSNLKPSSLVEHDRIDKMPQERIVRMANQNEIDAVLDKKKQEEEAKKAAEELKKEQTDKKTLKPTKARGAGGTSGGGGDPRARVVKKGVLGIVTGAVKGRSVASADLFGKGGFATNIDAVLQGMGGLKAGGGGGVGRKGAAGIGYGVGYGSGFGGGGSVDDLIGSLMGGDGGGSGLGLKDVKGKGSLKLSTPEFLKGGALTGGRSQASIMRVVQQNLAALRYAYNKRLREKPGLKGRISVKFAIDEFGKVIYCEVIKGQSTIDDDQLQTEVASKIRRWVFEKIDKPGDVTEVVYPFVFSN